MATLRKKETSTVDRDNHEENLSNNQSRDTNFLVENEDYKSQVSEKRDGRVTKTLAWVIGRTESQILGAPLKLDDLQSGSAAGAKNTMYCGYTTSFPSFSQSCIRQHNTARSFLQSSPTQLRFASCLMFARPRLAIFLEKSVKKFD